MQIKISKTLQGIIARTAFNTAKAQISHSLKDFLTLELLREEGALAYQILSSRLKDWELYQIRLRLEREVSIVQGEAQEPEAFFHTFSDELLRINNTRSISTAHALEVIAGDRTSATFRVLEMYGITAELISAEIQRLKLGEELHTDILSSKLTFDIQSQSIEPTPAAIQLLDKFGTDLTQRAREGAIDPVIGREREIERVVQILSRRKKNNPMLIGEAGVGKSAIVEGLALRIARGEVPHTIASKRLFSLDISSLVAGTKFRGEFEERMQQLLDELRKAKNTILFIDEIHTIVGAGATQGSLDTANILKPALARGELQTIGATTLDEYREQIESDAALERRFQKIIVEPTTPDQTLRILHNIAPHYARHHRVHYTDEALDACVALASRYLTDRHFPDKAIDLLDEAGSRAHLAATEHSTEHSTEITANHIRQVVTSITGIPAERISGCEMSRLRTLGDHLSGRVVGQEEAVGKLVSTIRRSRAGLKDESRPIGVFLFVGPTGVGKTLLAKEVSQWLFDEKRGLIRIDMSEYAEKHNVARLVGSPPGYIGYNEGGQLTEAVRRQPYAVVLFDEIEKAHPEVFNTLLQLFDEGHLTDGAGRRVDFRNTILIMTSNVGSRAAVRHATQVGYQTPSKNSAAALAPQSAYRKALEETFAPEFLNRIDEIVLFRSLSPQDVEQIIDLELRRLFDRTQHLGYKLRITRSAKRRLASMGYEKHYGARALKRTLAAQVEEPLSELIVEGTLREGDTVVIASDKIQGVKLRVA